jgi:predicted nucleotidyltransferase
MYEIRADESVLAEVVRRLVEAVDPDKILLFGSRARGDSRSDSDLDLLIVKDSVELRHRRTVPAYRALRGLGVPKDIVWYTPQELSEWAGVVNHLVWRALSEGRILYEKRR